MHLASAEYVEMQVIYSLAAILACVCDYAEAIGKALFGCSFCGDAHQVTEQGFVLFHGVRLRLDVFFRNHQQVYGRDWFNVAEDEALVVFVQFLRRDFVGGDAAEDTFAHGFGFYFLKNFGCWPGCHGS